MGHRAKKMNALMNRRIVEMDYKQKIIDELDILRQKEVQDRQVFKARAYAKVISQLNALDAARTITKIEDIQDISGIGDKIRAKIVEILSTGNLKAAQVIRNDRKLGTTDMLMQVYGIGPVKAKQLVSEHQVKDFDHLRELVKKTPGLLNEKQKIGLKYAEDLLLRIPRAEMVEHEKVLRKALPRDFHLEVVGSYRRGAETSGDIDVLLCANDKLDDTAAAKAFAEYCGTLQTRGYITDILALGPKKCMGVCRWKDNTPARRIDLLLTPKEQYAFAELYFTGSDKFNIAMRKHALEKGFTMNEHGMTSIREGTPSIPFMKTEKDIFTFLDYPYVVPKDRENKKNL